jgi:2-polyprenyl-6-hydroxyphenyl methylase / 3-demethylubiquinone-9 3-methyltransferase
MADTSMTTPSSSIVPRDAAHFGALAGDWWDPAGSSKMLHRLNPVRLRYIRDRIDQHWQSDERSVRPLGGHRALDVGCGAGLLSEPLCRLGAEVTGVDAAREVIAVAAAHAAASALDIRYVVGGVETIGGTFDLITAMEVIEHVADPATFLRSLADRLAPGGLLILSTPNRTAWSRLLTITLAEGSGRIPKGTHEFDQFIAPERMASLLAGVGLAVVDTKGIAFSPGKGLHLSEDLRLNYLLSAIHA